MAKAFLVLMLTASQVLAGTSGPRFLCFKADGSFCCVDNGKAECVCCPKEERKVEVGNKVASCGCQHDEEHDSEEPESPAEPTEDTGAVVSDNSGCSHVPVVDGALAATAKRSAFAVEIRGNRDLTTTPIHLVVHSNESRTSYLNLSRRSLTQSSRTLVDLAWVSIRC